MKKLIENFFYQASYQVLLIILPIITIPIVSRALGPSGIGEFNYVNSIVNYFILVAGLGIANYGTREIAVVRNNRNKLSITFSEIVLLNLLASGITLMVYMIFAFFSSSSLFFITQGITIFSCIFDITWFYNGIEDFKKITIRNFLIKVLSFICILLFVKKSDDLVIYFLVTAGSALLSQLCLWINIKKYVSFSKVSLGAVTAHLKPATEFFVAKIAMTLYQNTSKTILGLMTTMTIVGYYSNAMTLVVMAGSIVNAMNTILIPRMSNLFSEDREDKMIELMEKVIHLQLYFTIAITFGIIAINEKMIPWFYGSEFSSLKTIVPLLAPVVIFQSLQMAIAAQYLIPKKQMRDYNISVLIGAIVTTALNVILIPFFGVYGAVAGIFFGYLTICVLRSHTLIKDTAFRFNFVQILKFIISGVGMLDICIFLTKGMAANIITTVVQIGIGVISYVVISTILGASPIVSFVMKGRIRSAN